jgi:hypothetical protein
MTSNTDMWDRLDQEIYTWVPEPGDKATGTVTGTGTRDGEYGPAPTVTLTVDRGTEGGKELTPGLEIMFIAYRKIARDELNNLQPNPGDTIWIKYFGLVKGKDYHMYRFILERSLVGAETEQRTAEYQDTPAQPEPEEKPARGRPKKDAAPAAQTDDIPF